MGLYLLAHSGVLFGRVAGRLAFPWPHLSPPRGGLAPWVVLLAALAAGRQVARRLGGSAPRGVLWGIGTYAALVVPAELLGLAAWAADRPWFRPWTWAAVIVAGVFALGRVTGRPEPARDEAVAPPRREALVPWLWVAAVLVGALYLHGLGRTIRVGPRAWDGESYHLPVPLQWMHLSSLTEPLARLVEVSTWEIDRFSNPGDGHLLFSLPLLAGWDRVACLVQLPFAVLGAWAVGALARGAGASRAASLLSGLAFASAPLVAEQAVVPMLDLATGALTLSGLALLLPAAADPAPGRRVLAAAGLALGLALGTKTTALAHLCLVAALLLTAAWFRRGPWSRRLGALGVLAAALSAPSAFWYLRSAAFFGNPVHPIAFEALGFRLGEGMGPEEMSGDWERTRAGLTSRWEWLVFPFRDPRYSDETGFGALLVALGTLGLVTAAVDLAAAARERRWSPARRVGWLVAAGLAIFWFAAARTPRFSLPLLGLLAAAAAPALDRGTTSPAARRALGVLAVLLAATTLRLSLVYHGWDMGPPRDRREDLERDSPGIPAGLDALPPAVIFHDTAEDSDARPANYKLFGLDHRHLVIDHPQLPLVDGPAAFVERLRRLGADHVFLRRRKTAETPARYATPALEPVLRFEGKDYRSVLYRVR